MNKIRIVETFRSIQGEGRYAGVPMFFVRFSGCSRDCNFCDSEFHKEGKLVLVDKLIDSIGHYRFRGDVCLTGGEPLLQRQEMNQIINHFVNEMYFHLETNGDFLQEEDRCQFRYIAISPKDVVTAQMVRKLTRLWHVDKYDIKVVTDLASVGKELIPYATMLMPLTIGEEKIDSSIRRQVWQYCIDHKLRYSPRLHYEIWGKKRGV